MTSYNVLVVLFAILVFSNSEIVHFQNCPYPEGTAINCTIKEVRVNPCMEAAEAKPCRIKQPSNASISFDYIANFEGENLKSRAYWASKLIDIPFLGMGTDACLSTVCPTLPGQMQTYAIDLPISIKFPSRTYDIKWKLWNAQEQECCFKFQLKLYK